MSSISLTPAQHAILAHAIGHTEGRVEWFPEHIKGCARQKVLDDLAKRELIRQVRKRSGWSPPEATTPSASHAPASARRASASSRPNSTRSSPTPKARRPRRMTRN
ncbi:conserved hypothetical protein [Verminephrobacter eiseniae EF01-2]|uniref:Uncharacterized protein n=1 Tax=Verminephrobacter eiseniae (strain EF01-2) TaxID=391735 RepID=A1WMK0_VEREI|nr:conserved hypothetical protein [Verminephrobacter eiseniae EF01-2]